MRVMDAKRWTMAAGLCAGMGWLPALAQVPAKPAGHPAAPGAQVERPWAEMFRRLDKNGDGALSLDEFMAMERLARVPEEKRREIFRRLDKDGDGKLFPHELAALHEELGHGGRMPRLEELDLDHSGGISFEEFRQAPFVSKLPEEQQRALFDRLDRDGDGQLTPKDRLPGDGHGGHSWGRLAALDKDSSGGVSFEEFVQAPWVQKETPERQREIFDRLDRDHDGQLTPKDFWGGPSHGGPGGHAPDGSNKGEGAGHGARLKALDRDGDGTLSFEEFQQSPMLRGLSEEEQKQRFKALDKNGDGKLQPEEFGGPRHDSKAKPLPDTSAPAAPAPASPAPAPANPAPVAPASPAQAPAAPAGGSV